MPLPKWLGLRDCCCSLFAVRGTAALSLVQTTARQKKKCHQTTQQCVTHYSNGEKGTTQVLSCVLRQFCPTLGCILGYLYCR